MNAIFLAERGQAASIFFRIVFDHPFHLVNWRFDRIILLLPQSPFAIQYASQISRPWQFQKYRAKSQCKSGGPMDENPRTEVSELLVKWGYGDQDALNQLMPLVYDELRRMARRYLRQERPDHTLQTTALVHEAYLKLIDQKHHDFQNRMHFFAITAQMMRRILVDYARGHQAMRRGGARFKLSLDDVTEVDVGMNPDLIMLDDALSALSVMDPQQGRVVELRVFGGLTVEETAKVLKISPRTVKREWGMARAWLHR
jgi:RNA polymerase sigma factor (TIGR02999 family)